MKILIGYDGSECADAALQDLQRAGLGADVEALVMTVADVFVPMPLDEEVENTVPMYIPPAIKRAHERAEHKLAEATDIARRVSEQIRSIFPGWRVSAGAEADSPAWALVRKADSWKPDLIVMGARGQSVFGGRLILGSISQRVLYEARCSVRIARASDNHDIRVDVAVSRIGLRMAQKRPPRTAECELRPAALLPYGADRESAHRSIQPYCALP